LTKERQSLAAYFLLKTAYTITYQLSDGLFLLDKTINRRITQEICLIIQYHNPFFTARTGKWQEIQFFSIVFQRNPTGNSFMVRSRMYWVQLSSLV